MKTKLCLLLALCGFCAFGQQYKTATLSGVPPYILEGYDGAYTSNATSAAVIGLSKYEEVELQCSFKTHWGTNSLGSTMDKPVFQFAFSADGTSYATVGSFGRPALAQTHTTTTNVVVITNLYAGSMGYLKLVSVKGTTNDILTNIIVKYTLKPSRFGN